MEINRKEVKEMHPHRSADGKAKDPTTWVDSFVEELFTSYKGNKINLDNISKKC
jgi:hypothetical protein